MHMYTVFHKNNPFDFFKLYLCKTVDKFYTNYPVCMLGNVLSCAVTNYNNVHSGYFLFKKCTQFDNM